MSRKIGALWIKQSQDGRTYLSGVIQDLSGDINIAVFKNDKKEADKIAKKLQSGKRFDFNDFLAQLNQMKKML